MIKTFAPVVLFFFYQDVTTVEMSLPKARKLSGKQCFKYVVSIFFELEGKRSSKQLWKIWVTLFQIYGG